MNINGCFEDSLPKISVLMPVARLDKYFESALNSILAQTFCEFELIVLANGCSDTEYSELLKVCSIDKRVILKRLVVCGLMFALNYGIEISRADIIARMDCDDLSFNKRFSLQYDFLKKNKHVDVVGGRIRLIDADGKNLDKSFKYYESHAEIIKVLPYRNPLCHPALMMRKSALLKVWGYRYGLMSEDHEMFIRMMYAGVKFHNISDEILEYRRHPSQITDISKSYDHFCEVSSFLLMYFLKYKELKFLVGAGAIYPPIRKLRNLLLGTKLYIYKLFNLC